MAKRSEIFKALKANGWQFNGHDEACVVLVKGNAEAHLFVDTLNFTIGFMLNNDDDFEHGLYVGYNLPDIKVENGKLILPENGFCPYCG